MKLLNQRGEAFVIFIFVSLFITGTAVELHKKEEKYKQDMHYQKFHSKELEKEREYQKALEESRSFRI